jgi:hypothetical protein
MEQSLADLPFDLLAHICSFLPDACRPRRVNRRLARAAFQSRARLVLWLPAAWRVFSVNTASPTVPSMAAALKKCAEYFDRFKVGSSIRQLGICEYDPASAQLKRRQFPWETPEGIGALPVDFRDALQRLVSHFPSARSLQFDALDEITLGAFSAMVSQVDDVTFAGKGQLSTGVVSAALRAFAGCSSLRGLCLRPCGIEQSILLVLPALDQLEALELREGVSNSIDILQRVATGLTRLVLSGCWPQREGLIVPGSWPRLRSLYLLRLVLLPGDAPRWFAGPQQQQHWSLPPLETLSCRDRLMTAEVAAFTNLTRIHLVLDFDKGCLGVLGLLPQLRSLVVESYRATLPEIGSALVLLGTLWSLSVHGITGGDVASIERFSQLQALTSLELGRPIFETYTPSTTQAAATLARLTMLLSLRCSGLPFDTLHLLHGLHQLTRLYLDEPLEQRDLGRAGVLDDFRRLQPMTTLRRIGCSSAFFREACEGDEVPAIVVWRQVNRTADSATFARQMREVAQK